MTVLFPQSDFLHINIYFIFVLRSMYCYVFYDNIFCLWGAILTRKAKGQTKSQDIGVKSLSRFKDIQFLIWVQVVRVNLDSSCIPFANILCHLKQRCGTFKIKILGPVDILCDWLWVHLECVRVGGVSCDDHIMPLVIIQRVVTVPF